MVQKVDELELYHLDWDNPAFAADPWPEFEKARAKHPWLARTDAGYAVFELKAIRDLLGNDSNLRPSFDGIAEIMECKGSPWGRFCEEQMIALPDREHKLLRETFAAKFTPRYANQLRPIMRETMERLLRDWAPREKIDFEEFASYYPVSVMAQMVGAPLDVIPGLRKSMETMGLAFSMDKAMVPDLDKAFLHMDAFAHDLVAERRANPHGEGDDTDLLDILIEAGEEGGISDRQLYDLLIFLFVAGYDTSKNVLTYMMHLMTDNPEIYERCADDLDYCRKVVEETLRMFNPSSSFRATSEDIVYRDVLIPAGTMLFFNLNVSGRDPTAFDDPENFNPERAIDPARRHVAFGLGKHMCLGQYIARAQLQEGIHLIAQHMREPHEVGEKGWRPFPGVWGIKGLPIEFTPA
ncbi:MAG: cytochrome P450 [Novosphingobium sp.]|nr:cytochrome P450 [Novosphingobium sp.]MCP5404085.1 cytochrome P450 [Novosphingobium sp.]